MQAGGALSYRMALSKYLQRLMSGSAKDEKPAALPPYHAVTVTASLVCCAAARATLEHPILSRSKPRLPLPDCSMPKECECRFRKRNDRRGGERRFFGMGGQSQWSLKEGNKRVRADRRSGQK